MRFYIKLDVHFLKEILVLAKQKPGRVAQVVRTYLKQLAIQSL